ncbi:MAG: hypothetical protein M3A44_10040 [Gammaproteobacteria bacterium]
MNSIDNFEKSFENSVSGKDGDDPEIGSLVFHEKLTEESFIEEIFSSMAWNG